MPKSPPPPEKSVLGSPSLATIQREVARAVMTPMRVGERMQDESASTAERFIKPNDRLTAFERLELYNQQYWWRLQGAFAEDFRGLRALLGERKFDRLTTSYLSAQGSRSWNLRDLGQQLPRFLQDHPALTEPFSAAALEMAEVEWARIIAFDGPGLPPLNPSSLAGSDPTKLQLGIQPYVTLLQLRFPIDHLLGRLKRHESRATSNAVAGRPAPRKVRLVAKESPEPIYLAVHRAGYSVYFKRLDREGFLLLNALRSGEPLADACELAFADSSLPAALIAPKVQSWFAVWTELGWFCRSKGKN